MSLNSIKRDLKDYIEENKALLEAWERVTYLTKKDGTPFKSMSKNFNKAIYKRKESFRGYILEVDTKFTPNHRRSYFRNYIDCGNKDNPNTLEEIKQKVSEEIIKKLDEGKNVAYLTLGDPTVYSTYIYIQRIVKKCGYDAEIINGVPSFCAVAAKLGDSLADRSEQLHIIPSNYDIKEALKLPGNKILMKAASKLSDVKKVLKEQGQKAWMIENCGMEEEKIYHSVEEMPEKATYYTTLLVKEEIDKNS